jgi:hypothetical protein
MHSRWFNVAVVLLWLSTMSWLLIKKVLPAFWVGDPPDSRSILAAKADESMVGWVMSWNGHPMGWALNKTYPLPQGLTQLHSRVHFERLDDLADSLTKWLGSFGELGVQFQKDLRGLQPVFDSLLEYDSLGRLSRFESAVRFLPSPDDPAFKVKGQIDGAKLTLTLRVGTVNYPDIERTVPRSAMLDDAFSPQTCLPGLRVGQSWTVEIYSPLRTANDPTEILYVAVDARAPLVWRGRTVDTLLVVYRRDTGHAGDRTAKPVGRVWVRPDGVILRQEVAFFGFSMTLERLSDVEAAALASKVGYRP